MAVQTQFRPEFINRLSRGDMGAIVDGDTVRVLASELGLVITTGRVQAAA